MQYSYTHKQRMFIQEYLIDLNATQAAIRAGYSPRTARQVGSENLSKPVIMHGIEKAMQSRAERVQFTADTLLAELKRLAMMPLGSRKNNRVKLKALELSMKHLGMLK